MEKVSVLMALYNQEDFVAEAIQSILNQTHSDFQLIIYDDGSTDDSVAVVQRFRDDSRVRLIQGLENHGEAYARNQLLQASQTRYACWQDSDDLSNRYRLEIQLKAMALKKMVLTHWERFNTGMQVPANAPPVVGARSGIHFPTTMFAVDKSCRFDETITLASELWVDHEWAGRMQREKAYQLSQITECLYYYRNHDARWTEVKKHILAEVPAEDIAQLNYGKLVERVKQDTWNREVNLTLPPAGKNLDFWLDEFIDGIHRISAKGWVRILGEPMPGAVIYLAFIPNSGTGRVHCFDTTACQRPDVSEHFKQGDLNDSGFSFEIRKTQLGSGGYMIGLVVVKDGKTVLQLVGQQVEIRE